tara:strand:+ start:1653 stop:1844 length:192 start_codon:yes stop_codon:yes gene_type:complete
MNWLLILIIIGVVFTGGVMILGVATMSQGGNFNKKYGNRMMQLRVASQFVTLALVVLYLYLYT